MPKCSVFTFHVPAAPTTGDVEFDDLVVDPREGAFLPKLIVDQGGNVLVNTLAYQDAVNNAWVDDRGMSDATQQTGSSAGSIWRFGFQTLAGSVNYHYPAADYQSDLFFAGNMQMLARLKNFRVGGFTLQIDYNTRGNESFMCVALGGDDLAIEYPVDEFGAAATPFNGTYLTSAKPRAVLNVPVDWPMNTNTVYPPGYQTGAGDRNICWGWDARDSGRGAASYHLVGQGGLLNHGVTRGDRMGLSISALGAIATDAPAVTTWGDASYVVTGAPTGTGGQSIAFCGENIRAVALDFTQDPDGDGYQTIELGIDARFVKVAGEGTAAGASPSTDRADHSIGWTDGTGQVCFWGGTHASHPTGGARAMSEACLLKFGSANGASTTFTAVMELVSLNGTTGQMVVRWSTRDGVARQVVLFALGAELSSTGGGDGTCVAAPPAVDCWAGGTAGAMGCVTPQVGPTRAGSWGSQSENNQARSIGRIGSGRP